MQEAKSGAKQAVGKQARNRNRGTMQPCRPQTAAAGQRHRAICPGWRLPPRQRAVDHPWRIQKSMDKLVTAAPFLGSSEHQAVNCDPVIEHEIRLARQM
jgi:hypothetical protein